MRTADNAIPDSIIQLPTQNTTVILDIELGSNSRIAKQLMFRMESEIRDLSWTATPNTNGHTNVAINSEQIPSGLVWLVVSTMDGELLERRLIEFRKQGFE